MIKILKTRSVNLCWTCLNRKLAFDYDAQWRRFRKSVYDWNATTETWETAPAATTVFLYDGWNLIGELVYDGNGAPTGYKTYTWGLDISESLQGAGGVGGLLAANIGEGTYYPAYDANGNVMAYIDSLTGEVVAQFEYSPFGEPLRTTGTKAEELSYRFSTKYTDAETGLLYYGYRFYEPTIGRWINRDPIGEQGFKNSIRRPFDLSPDSIASLLKFFEPDGNLYGFNANDGINLYDYLGLSSCSSCSPCKKGESMGWKQGDKPNKSNGCGPIIMLGPIDIGDLIVPDDPTMGCSFTAACNSHDICYGQCKRGTLDSFHDAASADKNTEPLRLSCDKDFRRDMRSACDSCASSRTSFGYRTFHGHGLGGRVRLTGRDRTAQDFLSICYRNAELYYSAVTSKGHSAWSSGQNEGCKKCCCK